MLSTRTWRTTPRAPASSLISTIFLVVRRLTMASAIRSATISSRRGIRTHTTRPRRSEEHTSELQSLAYLVCRLLLEKKKKQTPQLINVTTPSRIPKNPNDHITNPLISTHNSPFARTQHLTPHDRDITPVTLDLHITA